MHPIHHLLLPCSNAAYKGAAERDGADRTRIADTVGIASPSQMARLTKTLKKNLGRIQLTVHTHSDFDLTTTNAVASLQIRASSVDAVALGLGERSGCARLKEIVGYPSLAKSVITLKAEFLKPLARYMAQITGRSIAGNRPVISEDIFTCETRLHFQGLQNKPEAHAPIIPDRIRAERNLLFGQKCGRRAILPRMKQLNSTFPDEITDAAIQMIHETASKY